MRNTWNDIHEDEEIGEVYKYRLVDRSNDRYLPSNYRHLRGQYLFYRGEPVQKFKDIMYK
ncbi:MAG: hypothetical protein Q9192_008419, partial [Flavoplaca navasiana]